MPYTRTGILLSVVAAVTLGTIACARAEDKPMDDPARLNGYAIEAGTEQLFAAMLGSGETLAGGCKLGEGQIERTAVVATYTCSGGDVVLQLEHPDVATSGGVRTTRFVITVKSGTPPAGLVDAIAERIRTREEGFQWKALEGAPQRRRWVVPAVAATAAAIVVLWILRRLMRRAA
jgi:hypothetical protein